MKRFIAKTLHNRGWLESIYVKIFAPSSLLWADYLRRHRDFEYIGDGTAINRGAVITDPYLVSIGKNCTLSDCYLISHDASISVIQNHTGARVDAVGPIVVEDNCFIGINATVLRNVTIGKNSIVAAGAVVTKDVPPNSVVAGTPARVVSTTEIYAEKLEEETEDLPWANIIRERDGVFDAAIEQELRDKRKRYYWKKGYAE